MLIQEYIKEVTEKVFPMSLQSLNRCKTPNEVAMWRYQHFALLQEISSDTTKERASFKPKDESRQKQ